MTLGCKDIEIRNSEFVEIPFIGKFHKPSLFALEIQKNINIKIPFLNFISQGRLTFYQIQMIYYFQRKIFAIQERSVTLNKKI